jgi:acetyltransferase-like isoleucine patch superfamily enzyme
MRTFLFALVFICPPFLKLLLLRWFAGARIGRGVHIGWFSSVVGRKVELGDYCEIRPLTLIKCDGEVSIGAYTLISNFNLVYGEANFKIGRHSYVGPQSIINVWEDVTMGDVSAIGSRSMIFTHGSFLPFNEGYWVRFAPVVIGSHAWLASGVFVHPGVTVGDNVFVNAQSVLSGDIPGNSVVDGNPARVVTTMDKLQRSMSPQRLDAALKRILRHFCSVVLERALDVAAYDFPANVLSFRYRGRQYSIQLVSSKDVVRELTVPVSGKSILLVNHPDWQEVAGVGRAMILDFSTLKVMHSNDPILIRLLRFLKDYYAIQFEFLD